MTTTTDAPTDRRALLDDASAEDLRQLFARVPALGDVVLSPAGRRVLVGGWIGSFHAVVAPGDLDDLDRLLADPAIIVATLLELSTVQFQLVALASWHGGSLTREQVIDDAGEEQAAELEADAEALAQLFLGHRRTGWLTLVPGVSEVIDQDRLTLRVGLETINSDQLGAIVRNLGYRKGPTRKAERIELLIRHLRDPDALRATVAELPADARTVLNKLLEDRPRSVYELDPGYGRRYWGSPQPSSSPLQTLEGLGLVALDPYESEVDIWMDVVVTLEGRLFDSWPRPAELEPSPIDPTVAAVAPVVGTLDRLLALWSTTPAEGLASGGIGVRAVKTAAKSLGVPPTTVATLVALAVHLGLLGVVTLVPAVKRGHTRSNEKTGWAPTALRGEWQELHPAVRWAQLVQAWRTTGLLAETEGMPDRFVTPDHELGNRRGVARDHTLAVLAELPEGAGAGDGALSRHLTRRYPFHLDDEAVGAIVATTRLLGLVPETGVVGLTELARQLLADPPQIVTAVGEGARGFVVQADHTIVAPPDLEPGLLARLDDYGICESAAGVRIYRLDETRIARAMDAGASAEAVLAFLAEHATSPVPQAVDYLVRDVARRHGSLRVGAAASYLTTDDAALLSRAVAIRPAKLRALAPTAAVSELARDKLVEVLRAKGLMPVAEDADGSEVTIGAPAARPIVSRDELPALQAPAADDKCRRTRARKLARS